jgi:hypothetical protein
MDRCLVSPPEPQTTTGVELHSLQSTERVRILAHDGVYRTEATEVVSSAG